jgi:hypothetical protein
VTTYCAAANQRFVTPNSPPQTFQVFIVNSRRVTPPALGLTLLPKPPLPPKRVLVNVYTTRSFAHIHGAWKPCCLPRNCGPSVVDTAHEK